MKRQQVKNKKASTRLILVHVQKMYKTYIYIGVPDYSGSSLFVFFSKNEEEAIPPGEKGSYPPLPDKQNTPGILYRNTNKYKQYNRYCFSKNEEEAIPSPR